MTASNSLSSGANTSASPAEKAVVATCMAAAYVGGGYLAYKGFFGMMDTPPSAPASELFERYAKAAVGGALMLGPMASEVLFTDSVTQTARKMFSKPVAKLALAGAAVFTACTGGVHGINILTDAVQQERARVAQLPVMNSGTVLETVTITAKDRACLKPDAGKTVSLKHKGTEYQVACPKL